ncbi:hypothetical protein LX32DRAFT_636275 [Colletotrichum zoysiae]|uniref:Uncharacterized protein n=1 Tax=Colletotrichum zoysiae TaxID=1216348 RepID=A0AAD9M892_9PEZI|nr:hypothetical protein LX32DRAFT_636275 [Colletotrichum zoysiae]
MSAGPAIKFALRIICPLCRSVGEDSRVVTLTEVLPSLAYCSCRRRDDLVGELSIGRRRLLA